MTRLLLLSTIVMLAVPARADVWQHAIDPSPAFDVYEALMTKGDEAAIAANSQSSGLTQVRKDIDTAIEAYRAAAKANPKSGEPFFRIGTVINSFFFDCERSVYAMSSSPRTCNPRPPLRDEMARAVVDAWDTFEALAPLDPRVNEILLQRAILRTKLVASVPPTKARGLLEGAAKDYQALLDRQDGLMLIGSGNTLVLGNLAETHMMLGNIDEAIETYQLAKKYGARASTMYGLAVALDRDDRQSDAFREIRALGVPNYEEFKREFEAGAVFFVPAGEEEYYFALCDEAFGRTESAIEHWKAFIRSGAHPKFQPRAKEHLDRLLTRKNLKLDVPLVRDLDPNSPTPFIIDPPTPKRPKPVSK